MPHVVAGTPPEDLAVLTGRFEQAEVPPERAGVVRIGRAAHASGAAMGQQGSFAIEEAALLARCLSAADADVPVALGRFRQQRAERLDPVPAWTRQMRRLRPLQRGLVARFQQAFFSDRIDRQLRNAEDALFDG